MEERDWGWHGQCVDKREAHQGAKVSQGLGAKARGEARALLK